MDESLTSDLDSDAETECHALLSETSRYAHAVWTRARRGGGSKASVGRVWVYLWHVKALTTLILPEKALGFL